MFNRGICQLYLGKINSGLTDLYHAQKSKETEEHDIIDKAIRNRGKGYSVYSMPPGLLFRPSETRLRQLKGINMFHDKLISQPYTASTRKNSILVHQPIITTSSEESLSLPSNIGRGDPLPIKSLSSSSSSSSLQSPISPVTPTHSISKHTSRRIVDKNGIGSDIRPLKENHRQSTNTTLNRNAFNNAAGVTPATSTNSSQTSLISNISVNAGKLKIKCHYTDTRILLTSTDINYQELKSRIAEKFKTNTDIIQLAYKDEENEKVLIIDDEDLDMARQINKTRYQHKQSTVEKLEIWI